MKTLKISVVATLAGMLAWVFGIAQKIWPAHPLFADFLLTLACCLLLQFTWSDAKSSRQKDSQNPPDRPRDAKG